MGLIKVDEKRQLTITYGGRELPFGGINTTREAVSIEPNEFSNIVNYISIDGDLVEIGWQEFLAFKTITLPGTADVFNLLFMCDYNFVYNLASFSQGNTLVCYSRISYSPTQNNFVGILKFDTNSGNLLAQYELNINQAGGVLNYGASFKNINGTVYISGPGFTSILAFNGTSFTNLAPTQNGIQIGGSVINELNGRLLLLSVTQAIGGVQVTFPYQIAWSAASSYGNFEPLINGLITGAGYNNLADVSDVITGFINSGSTGFILRQQGISEMTPNNSGIEPFIFNHFSVSYKGLGAFTRGLADQYGLMGAFINPNGVNILNGGNIDSTIGDKVWQLITANLQSLVSFNIMPANIRGNCPTVIVLGFSTFTSATQSFPYPVFLIGDTNTKIWSLIQSPVIAGVRQNYVLANSLLNVGSGDVYGFVNNNVTLLNYSISGFILDLYFFKLTTPMTGITVLRKTTGYPQSMLTFPVEEVLEYADITIDSIVVWVNLLSLAGNSFDFYINGSYFSSIIRNQLQLGLQMVTLYPITDPITGQAAGVWTGKNPQLSAKSNAGPVANPVTFGMIITKLTMYGSTEANQRP